MGRIGQATGPIWDHLSIMFDDNVCLIKICSKLSSVLLLCLLRIFMVKGQASLVTSEAMAGSFVVIQICPGTWLENLKYPYLPTLVPYS